MNNNRILLVGCPRSGTTILQAILSSHPKIFSLPETHFYPALCSNIRMVRKLGISTKRAKVILKRIESKYLKKNKINCSFFSNSLSLQYLNLLDTITVKRKYSVWLEKTPQNLWFIDYIKSMSSDLKFLHIERDPKDVIASIHYASTKYPDSWGYANLDDAIQLCRESFIINNLYRDDNDHLFCKYNDLIESPNSVIKEITNFLSIEMINDLHNCNVNKDDLIIEKNEVWKKSVSKGLKHTKSRFHSHFNNEQKSKVLEAIDNF